MSEQNAATSRDENVEKTSSEPSAQMTAAPQPPPVQAALWEQKSFFRRTAEALLKNPDSERNLWFSERWGKGILLGFIALCDYLLYQSGAPGGAAWSVAYLFLAALLLPRDWKRSWRQKEHWVWGVVLLVSAGLLFYQVNFFSFTLAYGLLAVYRCGNVLERSANCCRWLVRIAGTYIFLPFDWMAQKLERAIWRKFCAEQVASDGKRHLVSGCLKELLLWILPLGAGVFFLILFCIANPILKQSVGNVFSVLEFRWLQNWNPSEGFFWIGMLLVFSSFSGMAILRLWEAGMKLERYSFHMDVSLGMSARGRDFLGRSMVRALVVLNGLFLLQNILDVEYLWSGLELPDGMTFASYAHRGAYPLIAATIFAGVFALCVFQGKRDDSKVWGWARRLVYVWLAQNVFLTASALLRLYKYVLIYNWTLLRVAAALWMLLVACGLLLLIWKIFRDRSFNFLCWGNLGLVVVLWGFCAVADFSGWIAAYNIQNCREFNPGKEIHGMKPVMLDVAYLQSLGAATLPALLEAQKQGYEFTSEQRALARKNTQTVLQTNSDWRGFSLFDWLLKKQLGSGTQWNAPEVVATDSVPQAHAVIPEMGEDRARR